MSSDPVDILLVLLAAMFVIAAIVIAFVVSVLVGQRKSIREITKSERKFRYVFENSVVGMFRFDPLTGKVIESNEALLQMLGTKSPDEIPALLGLLAGGVPSPMIAQLIEKKVIEGHEILISFNGRKQTWFSFFGVVNELDGMCEGVVADITQQKHASQLLRQLTQRIVAAEENERRRVARELHDGVNQTLSLAKAKINFVDVRIPGGKRKLKAHSSGARQLLQSAIDDVRAISHNLRPSVLDDLGYVPAIRSLIDVLQSRKKIQILLETAHLPRKVPHHIELAMYRIIQECLTNIEKHSKATTARVSIEGKNSTIHFEITDNGIGIRKTSGKKKGGSDGMGLPGMRERIEVLGGNVIVSSSVGNGTSIVVDIPLLEPFEV